MNDNLELNLLLSHRQVKYRLALYDEQIQPIGCVKGESGQHPVQYSNKPYFVLTTTINSQRMIGIGNQLVRTVESFATGQGASWVRGQLGIKTSEYSPTSADERALNSFWYKNGYGLTRAMYDDSIRFRKPLRV